MDKRRNGSLIGLALPFLALSLAFYLGAVSCSSSDSDEEADAEPSAEDSSSSSGEDSAPSKDAPKDSGRMYVTIAGNNEVTVIDGQSHQIVTSIPVGVGPAIVLSTADHSKLYTANWTDDTVSAVDVAKEVSEPIALPGRPYVIAIAPNDKYVYAGLNSNQIAVIDTQSDEVERFISTAYMPASIVVSTDSETLYVAELTDNTLRALSAATGEVIHEPIAIGKGPGWITMTPDGSKVYTLNYSSDDISVVDTATFTVTETIQTGAGSKGIIGKVNPGGTRLYVTNLGTGDLIAIDTETNETVQRIALDGRPVGVNLSQDGKRVYVTDYGVGSLDSPTSAGQAFLVTGVFTPIRDGQVSVFNTTTGERIGDKIAVGAGPTSIVVKAP